MDRLPSPTAIKLEQTLKVAKSLRQSLTSFGIIHLIGFGMALLTSLAQTSLSPDIASLLGFVVLGGLLGAIFCLVRLLGSVYRCCSAMDSMGLLWVLAMLLPCLNLMSLLAINIQARAFLEQRGFRFGLFGPSRDEISWLERAVGRKP